MNAASVFACVLLRGKQNIYSHAPNQTRRCSEATPSLTETCEGSVTLMMSSYFSLTAEEGGGPNQEFHTTLLFAEFSACTSVSQLLQPHVQNVFLLFTTFTNKL